ncbi:MAG: hypothetical protein ACYC4L_03330 [Chloroflexota bacterium]
MVMIKRLERAPWWLWFVVVDLVLVAATLVHPYLPEAGPRWLRPFADLNLGGEMTIAAWWTGISLLVAALLAYQFYCARLLGPRLPWLILALVLLGLSFDEIGSAHERVGDGGWRELIVAGALVAAGLAYALLALFRRPETRRTAILAGLGVGLMGTVAAQEFVEHIVPWPAWALGPRSAIEEGTELLGVLLCLAALVALVPGRPSFSLAKVIPDPHRLSYLPYLLLAGLALHVLASISGATLTDVPRRGNPATWYPVSVLFIGACAAFWRARSGRTGSSGEGLFYSLALALLSLATVYQTRTLEVRTAGDALGWGLLALLQLGLFAYFYSRGRKRSAAWTLGALVVVVITWLVALAVNRAEVVLMALGASAFLITSGFLGVGASRDVSALGLGARRSPAQRSADRQ